MTVKQNIEVIDLKDMAEEMEAYQAYKTMLDAKKAELERIEIKISEYENKFKSRMENADMGFMDGYQISYKRGTRKQFDRKGLEKAFPKIVEQFTKEVPARRFSVKKLEGLEAAEEKPEGFVL